MANNIELVTKMLPLVDEVYTSGAKSTILEAPAEFVQETADANTIKIAKLKMKGLGNYNKQKGYPDGDINLTWETHQFQNDRGRRFTVDRMDNIESFSLVAARMVGDFLREQVIPEVDAYRFSKIASVSGSVQVEGTLTSKDVKDAVDTAITNLEEKEIDTNRLVLFMTPTIAQMFNNSISRTTQNGEKNIAQIVDNYNGIEIVKVPQTRFYKGITLDPAASSSAEGGYTKESSSGCDINFILMDKAAAYNVKKLVVSKLISPDENQRLDAWQFDFRMYHDTFVLENKAKGIYVHHKAHA